MRKAGKRDPEPSETAAAARPSKNAEDGPPAPTTRRAVAKVSHTLDAILAERLEAFAFYQRVSESSVIEHALNAFFSLGGDDTELGDRLRREGAGRRRKS